MGTGWVVLWEEEVLRKSGPDDYVTGTLSWKPCKSPLGHNAENATILSSHGVMRNIQRFDAM